MVVQHNLTAMNSNRMLGVTSKSQAKSTEKLSSGYKINRAADDAAGLSISEKMRKQIRGLTQASNNAQDGISAVQTAEGALTEVHDMLQRMNELAVKAANGTNSSDDRDYIQNEVDQLVSEIDRVSETTKFNETYLLKGDDTKTATKYAYNTVTTYTATKTLYDNAGATVHNVGDTFTTTTGLYSDATQTNEFVAATDSTSATAPYELFDSQGNRVAANGIESFYEDGVYEETLYSKDGTGNLTQILAGDIATYVNAAGTMTGALSMDLHVGADSASSNKITLSISAMSAEGIGVDGLKVDGSDGKNATNAIDTIKAAIQRVSTQRSSLGAVQNRLEHTINNLDNVVENTTSAESSIRDTDMATEMVKYSNNNILAQAGQSMLAQANQSNQGVLSLLQ